jgi:sugar-specific transcriptional regulator TrmB
MEKKLLQGLGLTESEAKVYLALLRIGELTSKGRILKEAKIAPSKIYHVLEKLMDKGLVSTITKNNVKHFAASPPTRIKDYIETKKEEIAEEEKIANKVMPKLEQLYSSLREKTTAEIFIGWKGLETAYSSVLAQLRKGETALVLGASKGTDPEKTKRFFYKYSQKAKQRGIKVKTIFNENARSYVEELEKEARIKFDKKFLFKTTPVEIAIAKKMTAIIILKTEPIVILVHDKETADSFKTYFEELWKIAKK